MPDKSPARGEPEDPGEAIPPDTTHEEDSGVTPAPGDVGATPAADRANEEQQDDFEARARRGEHMPINPRPQDLALATERRGDAERDEAQAEAAGNAQRSAEATAAREAHDHGGRG